MIDGILKCIYSKITNFLVVLVGTILLVCTLLILLYSPVYNKLFSNTTNEERICVSYTLFTEAQDLSMKHQWGNQSSKSNLKSNSDENMLRMLREIRRMSPFGLGKDAKGRDESLCYSQAEGVPQICYSQECLASALTFLKSINFKTDPCNDFYNFTCGNWSDQNPRPPKEKQWSAANILIERADNLVADLLKSPAKSTDPAPINQVKVFYAMCTNESQINKAGLAPLIRMLKSYGSWPTISPKAWNSSHFDINKALADACRLFNTQIIVNSAVGKRILPNTNGTTPYLYVGKPTTFSNPKNVLLNPKCHEDRINEFKTYFKKFARLLGNVTMTGEQLSEKYLEGQADDVINFEMRLARSNETHNQTNATRSEFNLTSYMDHLLSTSTSGISYADLTNKKLVHVDANYISNLTTILSSTSPRTVANYFGWRLGSLYSYLTTSEMFDLELSFLHGGTTPAISNNSVSRETVCVKLVTSQIRFSTAVQAMYVQEMRDAHPKTQADVTKLLGNLKEAFVNLVNSSTWMDPQSKDAALNRIRTMKELVAYPEEYLNRTFLEDEYRGLSLVPGDYFGSQVALSTWQYKKSLVSLIGDTSGTTETTDLDEWVKVKPQTVNAYNTLIKNLIVVPIAILQPPFYTTNGLQSLNYGGIGTILGHELAHAFRRLSNALSKLLHFEIGWSNTTTLKTFKRKTDCLLTQYDELETAGGDTNGKLTLNENIGDNVGMREAFFAYKKLTAKAKTEPRLPGLEMYTSEQLFFLSYGNTYCESSSPEAILAAVSKVHAPNQFRTNVPLRNLKEFAQAWNCPAGSAMNPPDEERCVIW